MCLEQQDGLGPITVCWTGSEKFLGDFSKKKIVENFGDLSLKYRQKNIVHRLNEKISDLLANTKISSTHGDSFGFFGPPTFRPLVLLPQPPKCDISMKFNQNLWKFSSLDTTSLLCIRDYEANRKTPLKDWL